MGEVIYLGALVDENKGYRAAVLVECPRFPTLTQSQTPLDQPPTFVHG